MAGSRYGETTPDIDCAQDVDPHNSGLIVLTSCLASTFDSTFVVEKPIHTAVAFLTAAVLSLLLASRGHKQKYHRSPEDDKSRNGSHLGHIQGRRPEWSVRSIFTNLGAGSIYESFRWTLAALTIALIVRIQATSFLLLHVECTGASYQSLLPIAVIILDVMLDRRQKSTDDARNEKRHRKTGQDLHRPIRQRSLEIGMTLVLCISSTVVVHTISPLRSTYICAASAPYIWMTPLTQYLTTAVDALVILCVSRVLSDAPTNEIREVRLSTRLRGIALSLLVRLIAALLRPSLTLCRVLRCSSHPQDCYEPSLSRQASQNLFICLSFISSALSR